MNKISRKLPFCSQFQHYGVQSWILLAGHHMLQNFPDTPHFHHRGILVKVLFFDKDIAIEALKRNASNPDFTMKMGFNHFLFALHITCFRMHRFSHISRRFSAISGTHRAQTIDLAISLRKQTFEV